MTSCGIAAKKTGAYAGFAVFRARAETDNEFVNSELAFAGKTEVGRVSLIDNPLL